MRTETNPSPELPIAPQNQRPQWQKPEMTKIDAGSAELGGGVGEDNDVFS